MSSVGHAAPGEVKNVICDPWWLEGLSLIKCPQDCIIEGYQDKIEVLMLWEFTAFNKRGTYATPIR